MPARCRKANAPKGGGAGAALDAVLLARRGQPACLLVEMSAPQALPRVCILAVFLKVLKFPVGCRVAL